MCMRRQRRRKGKSVRAFAFTFTFAFTFAFTLGLALKTEAADDDVDNVTPLGHGALADIATCEALLNGPNDIVSEDGRDEVHVLGSKRMHPHERVHRREQVGRGAG